jgi:DNA polymerase-3 subunit epsilon
MSDSYPSPNSTCHDFISIDVKTAQGRPWSICQFNLAIVEHFEIMQTISILIQPPKNEYSIWNAQTHGITPAMTSDKPTFASIWEGVYPIIQNKRLIAHRADFHIDCIKQSLSYYKLPLPDFSYSCTYKLTQLEFDDACNAFEIEINAPLQACTKVEACAKLYLKLLSIEKQQSYTSENT